MAITVDTSSYMSLNNSLNRVNADRVSNKLGDINDDTEDKELLDACKDFEQYFVEQVMKEFTKSLEEFNDNTYMQYFGDTLITEYAEKITDNAGLGIAQMLYESMKRS